MHTYGVYGGLAETNFLFVSLEWAMSRLLQGEPGVHRRFMLMGSAALALAGVAMPVPAAEPAHKRARMSRVRPGDAAWPKPPAWQALNQRTGGQLIKVQFPLAVCAAAPTGAACASVFQKLRNPYFIGDTVGLTQTLGWVDAWTTQPSVYAVAALSAADVAAAVNFAREHRLRLVVKGGGHSYLGTSNAPDSLMIWTRHMNAIELHDAFVPQGAPSQLAAQPAVTIGAGAIWQQAYNAVTTKAGRYVQGGGCMTVGVAGLVQSGGFGSFSKGFGTAAAGLLEAEIVTADGVIRVVNAYADPELFWALKGGGGGSFGVVTKLTLRTHDLPTFFGAVNFRVEVKSDAALRKLFARFVEFAAGTLCTPHWGEQITFIPNGVKVSMTFQGLDQAQAQAAWKPLLDWLAASPAEFSTGKPVIVAIPARRFWDASLWKAVPGVMKRDDRDGAPDDNIFWAGDGGQVGQVLHAYKSAWLPRSLLDKDRQQALVDALLAAAAEWGVALHFNKGLAGAAPETIAASRDTATNPAVLDAFALAISAGEEPPAYPGIAGHEPDLAAARRGARQIEAAFAPIRKLLPAPASYLSESDFFDTTWQAAYWGTNHARLEAAKAKYDPEGLFFVHHGVGSERWSADGFTRVG
jgi:FAD/FMN-containing dehydrogenase